MEHGDIKVEVEFEDDGRRLSMDLLHGISVYFIPNNVTDVRYWH